MPEEDRAGREGSRISLGRTTAGRYLRVVYVPDVEPEDVLKTVESRPDAEQNSIAAQISEALDDDAAWERSLGCDRSVLRSLAAEALLEHRADETQPLTN